MKVKYVNEVYYSYKSVNTFSSLFDHLKKRVLLIRIGRKSQEPKLRLLLFGIMPRDSLESLAS